MEFLRVCPTVRTSDYGAPFSFNDYRRLFMLKKLCAALLMAGFACGCAVANPDKPKDDVVVTPDVIHPKVPKT